MFCSSCGAQLPEDARFCSKCGAPVRASVVTAAAETGTAHSAQTPLHDPSLPAGITRDTDGAYHWTYRMNLWRNPVLLFTILKIMLAICLGLGIMGIIVSLARGFELKDILTTTAIMIFGIGGFLCVIAVISWCIVTAMNNSVYIYEYTMNDVHIVTSQTAEQQKKTKKLAVISMLIGFLSDDLTLTGAGLAAAASTSFSSDYPDVRAVIADRRHDLIKVNNLLMHNTVYAEPQQYDFVWEYLTSRCPQAKIKG